MARPHDTPSVQKRDGTPSPLILTLISLFHILTHHHSYTIFKSRRGKQATADDATPSRVRSSRNSSRGRDEGFPASRFDHQVHFDRWKGLENRDIVHERIVRLDGDEDEIFRERLLGLGWGFMYDDLVRINVTVVRNSAPIFLQQSRSMYFCGGRKFSSPRPTFTTT
ncbi:hypothetical protein PIB30_055332 [Stylosanthes scabra]|uniref:Uncharacterized protein n=1 Tax=Stylosanthes scabra TaxID=79078 RepID=A0ABU6TJH7_9FABA|nr:hypothetical protein [Stylosanthes scabra]